MLYATSAGGGTQPSRARTGHDRVHVPSKSGPGRPTELDEFRKVESTPALRETIMSEGTVPRREGRGADSFSGATVGPRRRDRVHARHGGRLAGERRGQPPRNPPRPFFAPLRNRPGLFSRQ